MYGLTPPARLQRFDLVQGLVEQPVEVRFVLREIDQHLLGRDPSLAAHAVLLLEDECAVPAALVDLLREVGCDFPHDGSGLAGARPCDRMHDGLHEARRPGCFAIRVHHFFIGADGIEGRGERVARGGADSPQGIASSAERRERFLRPGEQLFGPLDGRVRPSVALLEIERHAFAGGRCQVGLIRRDAPKAVSCLPGVVARPDRIRGLQGALYRIDDAAGPSEVDDD